MVVAAAVAMIGGGSGRRVSITGFFGCRAAARSTGSFGRRAAARSTGSGRRAAARSTLGSTNVRVCRTAHNSK